MRKLSKYVAILMVCMIAVFTFGACASDPAPAPEPADPGTEADKPEEPAAPTFPEKEIRLIAAFGPGASGDMTARAIAQVAPDYLNGQPMIVENVDGAGGVVAASQTKDSKNDGYTILFATSSLFTTQPMFNADIPFQQSDFDFIAPLAFAPFGVTINANNPATTLQEFLDTAKAEDRTVTFGCTGTNTGPHVLGAQIFEAAGVKYQHVPFKSGGDAIAGVLGDKIEMQIGPIADSLAHTQAGTTRTLAYAADERAAQLPDVPTLKEAGYDFTGLVRYFIVAPVGIPEEANKVLAEAFPKIMADPVVVKTLAEINIEIDNNDAAELVSWFETTRKGFEPIVEAIKAAAAEAPPAN